MLSYTSSPMAIEPQRLEAIPHLLARSDAWPDDHNSDKHCPHVRQGASFTIVGPRGSYKKSQHTPVH